MEALETSRYQVVEVEESRESRVESWWMVRGRAVGGELGGRFALRRQEIETRRGDGHVDF